MDWKYTYKQLDKFGLLFGGFFLGALFELTNTKTSGVIIGIIGITCIVILMLYVKRKLQTKEDLE